MGDDIRELLRRDVDPAEYAEIRELWKRHSKAEDSRDLDGLISTLTPDCVYEIVGSGYRWEGHDGARRFYTEFLGAYPDVVFSLTHIVIGPQGVYEEADVTATAAGPFAGRDATSQQVRWQNTIFFPWDRARRLFGGERVYVAWPD